MVFSFSPKIYLWKKKAGPPPKFKKEAATQKMAEEKESVPKVVDKSYLKDLTTRVETGLK